VSLDQAPASLSWWELVDQVGDDYPEVRNLVSCGGDLDAVTADALHDSIGDTELNSLRWLGYAGRRATKNPVTAYGNEYSMARIQSAALRAGERVPEFVWDDAGTFAWGARLYPDSLIVACESDRFTQLHTDPRLDTVTVRVDTEVLPSSSGD
jgi:hypothetical protein